MKIYLAPLEGITGYTYRRALYQCFGGFDKYFIPFILPNQKGHLSTREKKDIMPENNEGMYAVPRFSQRMQRILSRQRKLCKNMDIKK